MHNHKWSLTELENMMPWERDIYIIKLQHHVEEENKRMQEQQRKNG